MNRADFKEMVKDISRLTGIPRMLIYSFFTTAIAAFSLGILTILGLATSLILIQPKAQAAKPDSCQQYHEKALKALDFGEKPGWPGAKCRGEVPCGWISEAITAYSLLYQNCRDLERRESR